MSQFGHIHVTDEKLGKCCLDIYCDGFSAVDSYITAGYSETLDRELTDNELDQFQDKYAGEVQEYSYGEGGSLNHN